MNCIDHNCTTCWVVTNAYNSVKVKNKFIFLESSLIHSSNQFSPVIGNLSSDSYCHRSVLFAFEFHRNGGFLCIFVCVLFLSLNKILSRFIHAVACISILWLQKKYFLVDRHTSYFQFLNIMIKASINNVYFSFFVDIYFLFSLVNAKEWNCRVIECRESSRQFFTPPVPAMAETEPGWSQEWGTLSKSLMWMSGTQLQEPSSLLLRVCNSRKLGTEDQGLNQGTRYLNCTVVH